MCTFTYVIENKVYKRDVRFIPGKFSSFRLMGYISSHGANACVYTAYAVCLLMGLGCAWFARKKGQFLAGNGTRKALPLTFNFIASGKY